MPRPYRLGERAGQVQATRERIVEAAIDLYAEVGASKATLRDVGIRADVAPNTLRNWGRDGKITEHRHPVNNYRLYKKTDLDRLLREAEKARA